MTLKQRISRAWWRVRIALGTATNKEKLDYLERERIARYLNASGLPSYTVKPLTGADLEELRAKGVKFAPRPQ